MVKNRTFGYCRCSTARQNIQRQVRNILREYPDAHILEELYSGVNMARPVWMNLYSSLKKGDTVVFDSVSRMSRNADEGVKVYMDLYDRGVNLVFLNEPAINTSTYKKSMDSDAVPVLGTDEDLILEGINKYIKRLATKQIRLAFEQSEKEVMDLHKRVSEGLVTARLNGKTLGRETGRKYTTKKEKAAKDIMLRRDEHFGGSCNYKEIMKLCDISLKTYYKYLGELVRDLNMEELDDSVK